MMYPWLPRGTKPCTHIYAMLKKSSPLPHGTTIPTVTIGVAVNIQAKLASAAIDQHFISMF